MLNNTEAMCLFKTTSDAHLEEVFDAGAETNVPDDVKWAGLDESQRTAVKRLYAWIRFVCSGRCDERRPLHF